MYNFIENFTILNVECFYYCIITIPALCVSVCSLLLHSRDIFIPSSYYITVTSYAQAEDAVCLADYCDIMRCEVLMTQEVGSPITGDPAHINTDIEIWSEATAYRTALSPSGPRDLARVLLRGGLFPPGRQSQPTTVNPQQHHCPRAAAPDMPTVPNQPMQPPGDDNNATADMCDNSNLVDSALPPADHKQQRLSELQKLKANCKPEELQKLKLRCEVSSFVFHGFK